MKFSFLPEEIKSQIDPELIVNEPMVLARSNMAIDTLPGESFLIAYDEKFYVFSKPMGSTSYIKIEANYADMTLISCTKKDHNSVFEFSSGRKKYTLKFAIMLERELNKIVAKWMASKITLHTAFVSALLFVALADEDFPEPQQHYVLLMAGNNQQVLTEANYIVQHNPPEILFPIFSKLNSDQKYCIISNLFELAMSDEILRSTELKMIRKFSESMGLTKDEYATIKHIMVMKNKLGVLRQPPGA